MGQEYFINSEQLEAKIRSLLPSQGGAGAGFDLSASTQIIPVVALTESAEGSNLRQDLQSSLSHKTVTDFDISFVSSVLVNTTGYYRVFGNIQILNDNTAQRSAEIFINNGTTQKSVFKVFSEENSGLNVVTSTAFDFIVKLEAGDTLEGISTDAFSNLTGCTRQIADILGNLTNP